MYLFVLQVHTYVHVCNSLLVHTCECMWSASSYIMCVCGLLVHTCVCMWYDFAYVGTVEIWSLRL